MFYDVEIVGDLSFVDRIFEVIMLIVSATRVSSECTVIIVVHAPYDTLKGETEPRFMRIKRLSENILEDFHLLLFSTFSLPSKRR